MEFNNSSQSNQVSALNNLKGNDTASSNISTKDRLESVDTIRQILFGEDRRVLDAKIQSLTTVYEQLAKSHKEDLANLEARLRKSHEEETSILTKMLAESQASQKTALDALASNVANTANISNAAIENKLSMLNKGLQSQTEASSASLREATQASANAIAQLRSEHKLTHDASVKSFEEKITTVDKKLVTATQNLTNYVSAKQFSHALRSLAKEFDVAPAPVAANNNSSTSNSAFQR
jgi:hypothetical protein